MSERYSSIEAAARQLGLPVAWLRREVQEGRLPFVQAGRRILVSPADVREALNERAAAVGGMEQRSAAAAQTGGGR